MSNFEKIYVCIWSSNIHLIMMLNCPGHWGIFSSESSSASKLNMVRGHHWKKYGPPLSPSWYGSRALKPRFEVNVLTNNNKLTPSMTKANCDKVTYSLKTRSTKIPWIMQYLKHWFISRYTINYRQTQYRVSQLRRLHINQYWIVPLRTLPTHRTHQGSWWMSTVACAETWKQVLSNQSRI